uniref:Receptor ligand binding region domain-containing protein n=1 Tax=Sinocyclocheilus grahami TaxID=75366 RepID=A0A672NFY4_SINGR
MKGIFSFAESMSQVCLCLDVFRVLSLSPHSPQQNITLAVILPLHNTEYPWAWPRVGPALHWALDKANSDPNLLPGYHLQLVFNSSENKEGVCSDSVAPLVAVDLKFSYNPWAFIGPGCDYSSSPVARFTTHWEVPMITGGARALGFNLYSSITNIGPTHKKLGEFVVRMHRHFGWHKHALLMFSDNKKDDRPCYFAVEGPYTQMLYLIAFNINLHYNKYIYNTQLSV